ncbi:hypothetical protein NW762_006769 [Fusarium torreyae]|uniref:Ankyrin n=1 Tax=Fusarium torreyae TaxID=1237075 RepID=A0A9W8S321_9HYPO|nr:hypothetical protein NW762_006769 [Fusarium torreyae]
MIRTSVITYNVFPNDADGSGEGLLEFALNQRLNTALDVLLDLWKNVLPEIGLPRNVAYEAEYMIRNLDLHDHQQYLVQKALSFVKDRPERTMTKVHIALYQGTDLHEALQEQPWAIDMIDDTSHTPLHIATRKGQLEEVEVLIAAGADIDQQTHDGWTALMLAVTAENVEIVKLLLKARCSVNVADIGQVPSLHWAARGNTPVLVGLLLAAGASLRQRDHNGDMPLHKLARYSTASFDNMRTIIETLVMAGADLEARNDKGKTALMDAVIFNNITAVRALVEAGASLSPSDHNSQNLLHFAAEYASLEILEYLCDMCLYGINTYQRNSWGDTPWDAFIDIINSDEWDIGLSRYPSPAEQGAFVRLYQGIRDRNLQHDIDGLEQTVSVLSEQDSATAREHLAPLLKRVCDWKRDNLVSWYRAVDKRIEHSEWALAVEDVEEYIIDLREELGTPVWQTLSKYGYPWDSDDESLTSAEEPSENGENPSEDDEEASEDHESSAT